MPVQVAGEKMNWMFDTGAECNVIDALSKKKILKEFNVTRRVNLTGAGGQKKGGLLGYDERDECWRTDVSNATHHYDGYAGNE